MPLYDLRSWLQQIEQFGELRRVDAATCEEDIGMATEVLQHADESPAVIFDNIPGYCPGYRVLVNSLGSLRRLALTLGVSLDVNKQQLIALWQEKLDNLHPLPPQFVDDGPVMENIHLGEEVNVLRFPTPKWHEGDGGAYIGTASCDITRDPDEGWINLGTYRVMIHDAKRLSFYIAPGKQGRIHRDNYFAKGEPCPVAIAIGLPPLLYLASSTQVEHGLSEYDWTGGIAGEPVKVIRGRITGLPIPADAEIVLEGFASPEDRLPEGPFGEWTGYYASGSRAEPVIDVKAIYHRNDPILTGSPPAKPPYEVTRFGAYIRSAAIRKFVVGAGIPNVTGVWVHPVANKFFLAISIKQSYPGHARQAGHVAAMCQAGAYLGRYVIVVDEDIDVTDLNDVVWAMCTRSDPERSVDLIRRAWSGPLDPAIHPDMKGFNSRLIIDACRPYEWRDRFPKVNEPTPEARRQALEKWGYLIK